MNKITPPRKQSQYRPSDQSKHFDRPISKFYRLLYSLNPSLKKYEQLVSNGHILRPHYAYALLSSAKEAVSLGYKKISVIEFGCAGGSGLIDLEYISNEISKILDISFEIYGFDAGDGMPKSTDYRDLLYMWSEGEYKMDHIKLNEKLHNTQIVIGDTKDTVPNFIKKFNPAPIGTVFIDVDYYTSTKSCLEIFNHNSESYLPRVFVYLDDTRITSEFTGELLAINEYNQHNEKRKISVQTLLAEEMSIKWKNWIYLGKKFYHWHCFEHKKYSTRLNKTKQELPL
jgi:hypothetical protein